MAHFVSYLLHLIAQYGLDDRNAAVAQLRALAEHGRLSESQARTYMLWLEPFVQEQIDRPNLLHRPPDRERLHADGEWDISLGKLIEADLEIGIRLLDRPRHILVAGTTGSGKTTAIRRIIQGIEQLSALISQIIFDHKAGDYAGLTDMYGDNWIHLSVHGGMHLGLNAPRGIPPNVWINVVSTILAARLGLVASAVCLANIMRFLLAALNPNEKEPLIWPDIRLIWEVIRTTPLTVWAGKAEYGKTLITALEGLLQASGDLLHTFNGLDVDRDIVGKGKSLVIDMVNLFPPSLRLIVVDLILSQILLSRLHRHQKADSTEVVITLDEADADLSRQSDAAFPDGFSPAARLLKQGREMSVMAVLGVTFLGNVSRQVLAGPQYHLIFNQSDAESMIEARRTLVLPQGSEQMFPALKPGECIFRQAQSSWPHPMLCKVDYIPSHRTPKVEGFDTHSHVPSSRLDELPNVQKALEQRIAEHNKANLRRARTKRAGFSEQAQALLRLSSEHPYWPIARLWEKFEDKPHYAKQKTVRKELENHKLAAFEEVRIGRTNVLLIDILRDGWRLLDKPKPNRIGRGGIAHRHFSHWIALVGKRRGYKTACEWTVPGTSHPVDAAWCIDGHWHVFEVVITCEENLTSHITACLIDSDNVATVAIVATQKSLCDKLERSIVGEILLAPVMDRVRFEVITTYIEELWPR